MLFPWYCDSILRMENASLANTNVGYTFAGFAYKDAPLVALHWTTNANDDVFGLKVSVFDLTDETLLDSKRS